MYEYAPIAKALHKLDNVATGRIKCKFDIAYLTQNMAIAKMGPQYKLKERHGVDLGQGYKNELACANFIDYIAHEQQQGLVSALSKVKYFSLQADGSTDASDIKDEVFLAFYCNPYSNIHVRSKFFIVRRPARTNAQGLFDCLRAGIDYVGVSNWQCKLIGFGCDSAIINMGAKGFLLECMPMIVVFWCFAHCLELDLQDTLAKTYFSRVDELLLRIYYLYEKSHTKWHELWLQSFSSA